MAQVSIVNENIELSGDINFGNVRKIEDELLELLHKCNKFVNIQLGNVTSCDSALLGLIMVLFNFANKKNVTINFNDAPEQLISMAALSNLDTSLK